jgi:hypothetical protein
MNKFLLLLSLLFISCSSFIRTDDEQERANMANALIELSALSPSDEEVAAKTFGVSNRLDKWAAKWPREFAIVLVKYQEEKYGEDK